MIVMKKFKKAMTLAEVLLAFGVCGVVFLVSINMFQSMDVKRLPYVYSTMNNLREVNSYIMTDCFNEGTCSIQNVLPNSLQEYCTRLNEKYNTSGDVICTIGTDSQNLISSDTSKYQRTNGNDTYNYNLKLTSGVEIFGILDNANWKEITYGTNNHTSPNKYIDIIIDTNGKNEPNKFLDDVYPIRIFSNGDVVPGVLKASSNGATLNGFDYADIYEYTVRKKVTQNDSTTISIADMRTAAEKSRNAAMEKNGVNFREALCRAYGNTKATTILQRYYNDALVSTDWCSAIATNAQAADCAQDNTICEVKQTRPKTNGFVKFIGL